MTPVCPQTTFPALSDTTVAPRQTYPASSVGLIDAFPLVLLLLLLCVASSWRIPSLPTALGFKTGYPGREIQILTLLLSI